MGKTIAAVLFMIDNHHKIRESANLTVTKLAAIAKDAHSVESRVGPTIFDNR